MKSSKDTPFEPAKGMERFARVDTWVFDLDNTLYPFGSPLWPQIDQRITAFFTGTFGIDGLSARALQKHYYERYGTSLRGLMVEDGIQPESFLEFVHDIDRSSLLPNQPLAAAIAALPGRKLILTNGSHTHALRTCEALGIDHLFDGMFDIVASDMVPKPEAGIYERFFDKHSVDPSRAAMFEDLSQNLLVPHQRGMATVLVVERHADLIHPPHIDFTTPDLVGFLQGLRKQASITGV